MTWWNLLVILSYLFIIVGSVGMMIFMAKYPFGSGMTDLEHTRRPILGLNGKQFWLLSWFLIIAGTAIQLMDYVCTSVVATA